MMSLGRFLTAKDAEGRKVVLWSLRSLRNEGHKVVDWHDHPISDHPDSLQSIAEECYELLNASVKVRHHLSTVA